MSRMQIDLKDENRQKLEALARDTGKTRDELVNEAVERLPSAITAGNDWKVAWRQAAGMWRNRDDIPDLMAEIKREWNRFGPANESTQ